jgi:serine/threonine protein kinase
LLAPAYSQNAVFRQRLYREARAAGRLREPHVVPVHQCGEINGQLFIDMRLIDGTDLQHVLANDGPLSPARAVAIVRQIAAALDAAHSAQMVHRDVKPANILLTADDFACLVDFGLANAATDAKLTSSGTTIGTFAYMAPERLSNAEVTHRADIYALACVLYECLTGSPPYATGDLPALISAHLTAPIPRPSQQRPEIPADFDQVIENGMAKNPDDRYGSAGELARAAHHALTAPGHDPADTILASTQVATDPNEREGQKRRRTAQMTSQPPTAPPEEESPWEVDPTDVDGSRSRWSIVIGAIVVVLLLAVAVFVIRPWQQQDRSASKNTSTPTPTSVAPSITFDGMRDFVEGYYADLPAQPEKAWAKLDAHYQNQTGLREYLNFWATIQSVTVISVSPRDAASVVARLTYVRRDGKSNTEDRWFEMILVNGAMLLDESDIATTDSTATPPPAAATPTPPANPTITATTSPTYPEQTETAASGSTCSDQGKLAHDASTGKELYCATFSQDHWVWSQAPADVTGLHTTNTSCDPDVEVTSRSPDGYLITCRVPYGSSSPSARSTWQHFQGMFE